MYLHIDWRKLKEGVAPGLRQALCIFNIKGQLDRSEEILWQCTKDEELSSWKGIKLLYGILSLLILPA